MNIYDEWFDCLNAYEIQELTGVPIDEMILHEYYKEAHDSWDKLSNDQKQSIWFNANNEF